MPTTTPTEKQADKIYEKRTIFENQRHIWFDNQTSSTSIVSKKVIIKPDTLKKIKSNPSDTITETPKTIAETLETSKTSLIVGSIVKGSVALLIYEIY